MWPSLRHSCRSELTRQGISLDDLKFGLSLPNRISHVGLIPACRHADGTISSLLDMSVWRVVSEDFIAEIQRGCRHRNTCVFQRRHHSSDLESSRCVSHLVQSSDFPQQSGQRAA